MKLYKFRGLTTCKDLKRIVGILNEEKFYCSKFDNMNDPMEGVYISTDENKIEDLLSEKYKKRICSFSSKEGFSNAAMWGYYASGFKGIAIEVEVNDADDRIKKVNYCKEIPEITDINKILTTKLEFWKHESEYRFIDEGEDDNYKIGKIKKVYFGLPYGNLTNSKEIIERNENIQNYAKYKIRLEEFLKSKGIEFSYVIVEGMEVKEMES